MTPRAHPCIALLAPMFIGILMLGQPAYGQDSDAKRFIELTRQMEEHPTPMEDENRKWMIQIMTERDDIQVNLELTLIVSLLGIEKPDGPVPQSEQNQTPFLLPGRPELFSQYMYGQAAYQLEHPDRLADALGAQLAGLRGLLAVYPKLREQRPDAGIEHLDQLLALGSGGQLESELRRLALPNLTLNGEEISDRFWGEWAADTNQCGVANNNRSIEIWNRGVRFSQNLGARNHWNYWGGRGLGIARYEKTGDHWGYTNFEFLQMSEDQTHVVLETDRDVPRVYYRCPPEEQGPPTSLAEAIELAKQSMTAEGADEWFKEKLLRNGWLESVVGAMHRGCEKGALEGDDQSFALYFRLAETGRVKESLLEGKTPYSACFYARMTNMITNFPAPIKDDFWMKLEMDMTPDDDEK